MCPGRTHKLWSWRRDLNPRPSDYKFDGGLSIASTQCYFSVTYGIEIVQFFHDFHPF